MRRSLLALTTVALVLAAARPAHAQMGVLSPGLAFGSSTIRGDFHDAFQTGWHAEGLLRLSLPLVPIGLRGELAYDQLDARAPSASAFKAVSGVLDATFSLLFPLVHPYAIGGVGYYYRNAGGIGGNREGMVGLNGGLGAELRLPVLSIFAEARYHTIGFTGGQVNLLPLTVGIIF